jgi:uncharacterized protein YqeY
MKKKKRDDFEEEDDEVGYGKPPKSGQFRKGVSGNPSGRPKKPSNFEAKVLRELNAPLVINENGKKKVITKDEAIAKQMVNKAVSGQVQSIRLVDNWRRQGLANEAEERRLLNRTAEDLSDEELTAIIRRAEAEESASEGTDRRKPGERKSGQ